MKNAAVQWVRKAAAATITITGRTPGNRIDRTVAQELCTAALEIADDDDVAVVLLRARGPSFSVGADTSLEVGPDWAGALAALPQPLIAAVHGDAVDEGAELALIADLRLCARNARFRFGHLGRGRLPSHGATQRLPRAIGRMRALDVLLSGRWLSAAESARIGLVNEVVAAAELDRRGRQLCRELATKGPIALRFAKEAISAGSDMTLAQGIRLEQDLYVLLQTTADRAEGIQSFRARRRPLFRGR
jgi:enoyl-CoA hydratase/carnithine racemase